MSQPTDRPWRVSGMDPADIKPGSPLHPHDQECEMGYLYGPWKDCGCMERATGDGE